MATIGILGLLAALGAGPAAERLPTRPFEAPKYGLKVQVPDPWKIAVRERDDRIFVALIAQADPERPGVAACELGLAPETLDDYRTRIDANARRGNHPGKLLKNEVVKGPNDSQRLETHWEFRPEGATWHELSIRVVANRQMYTFIFNVDDKTFQEARADFDALVSSAAFGPPDSGCDPANPARNRWAQREFKFALDLPEGWRPALAPSEIALFYAMGPAHGIWSDNALVVAQKRGKFDLDELAEELPKRLKEEDPNCEVLVCKLVPQGPTRALETIVRTKRGPFSMTIVERRFRGGRYDYEVKYTLESDRFDVLAPAIRRSLDSFGEVPGEVPEALPSRPS